MNVSDKKESSYEPSEFTWFLPAPRKPVLSITIPNDNCFNLNQKLYSQINDRIAIGVNCDGKRIRIKLKPEVGYSVPKSGIIKDLDLIAKIKKCGIKLPASYLVEQKEDYWEATLVTRAAPLPSPKKSRKIHEKMALK